MWLAGEWADGQTNGQTVSLCLGFSLHEIILFHPIRIWLNCIKKPFFFIPNYDSGNSNIVWSCIICRFSLISLKKTNWCGNYLCLSAGVCEGRLKHQNTKLTKNKLQYRRTDDLNIMEYCEYYMQLVCLWLMHSCIA